MKFKTNPPVTKSTRLEFGQYKGKLVRDVMKKDAQYLLWAHNKISGFNLSEEIIDEVVELSEGQQLEWLERDSGTDPDFWDRLGNQD